MRACWLFSSAAAWRFRLKGFGLELGLGMHSQMRPLLKEAYRPSL